MVNFNHDQAMAAVTQLKALRAQYPDGNMPADVKVQFDAYMADWTKFHAAYTEAKAMQEQFAAIDQAETLLNTPSGFTTWGNPATANGTKDAATTHREAFGRFLAGGSQMLTVPERQVYMSAAQGINRELLANFLPKEQYALIGTVDSLGGMLVTEDWQTELIRASSGFSVMRGMCKVKRTASNRASFMTVKAGTDPYSTGLTSSFRSEGWITGGAAPATQDQPRFGRETVTIHIWAPDVVELTQELLSDSAVNLEAELSALLAEVRGLDEDSVFILGTGIGMPLGIHTEAALGNITTVSTVTNDALSYGGLVNLYMGLPAQYRGRSSFLLNSATVAAMMLLEDTEGHNIFPPNAVPMQLFGRPLMVSEFMPSVANASLPIICGDFSYYGIVDRADMRIIRLVERFAPNVGILAVARLGGQTLFTGAFRAQVVA